MEAAAHLLSIGDSLYPSKHALAIEILRIVAPRSLAENDGHSTTFSTRWGRALSRVASNHTGASRSARRLANG
jgi:hypothetical protein